MSKTMQMNQLFFGEIGPCLHLMFMPALTAYYAKGASMSWVFRGPCS